ncbi:hypothetical protein ACFPYJ_18015 [Paenibacillus solisilvae]|uniref:Uncharacterized protein n=2 Tax=Paenibacillus solisilvae TaxID=2486751 RepID=A0ABW0VYF9_9BACL
MTCCVFGIRGLLAAQRQLPAAYSLHRASSRSLLAAPRQLPAAYFLHRASSRGLLSAQRQLLRLTRCTAPAPAAYFLRSASSCGLLAAPRQLPASNGFDTFWQSTTRRMHIYTGFLQLFRALDVQISTILEISSYKCLIELHNAHLGRFNCIDYSIEAASIG